MITYSTVQEIYANNFCSERLYKRKDCPNLVYTDGVMDFAEELNAHWVIDNVISCIITIFIFHNAVMCVTPCLLITFFIMFMVYVFVP